MILETQIRVHQRGQACIDPRNTSQRRLEWAPALCHQALVPMPKGPLWKRAEEAGSQHKIALVVVQPPIPGQHHPAKIRDIQEALLKPSRVVRHAFLGQIRKADDSPWVSQTACDLGNTPLPDHGLAGSAGCFVAKDATPPHTRHTRQASSENVFQIAIGVIIACAELDQAGAQVQADVPFGGGRPRGNDQKAVVLGESQVNRGQALLHVLGQHIASQDSSSSDLAQGAQQRSGVLTPPSVEHGSVRRLDDKLASQMLSQSALANARRAAENQQMALLNALKQCSAVGGARYPLG